MNTVFRGVVKNRNYVYDNESTIGMNKLAGTLEGKEFECRIEKRKKHRSDAQRGYFHGVIVRMIAREMGEEDEDRVLEELEWKFMFVKGIDGGLDSRRSVSTLTTVEQEELNEKVRMWAAKFLGLTIPDPERIE